MRAVAVVSVVRWVTDTSRGYLGAGRGRLGRGIGVGNGDAVRLRTAAVRSLHRAALGVCRRRRARRGWPVRAPDRRIAAGDGGRGRGGVPGDRGPGVPACGR